MISPDELSHFENIWEREIGNLGHDDSAQRRHQFGAMPLLQARQRKERSHHEFAGGRDTIRLVAQMVRRVGVFSGQCFPSVSSGTEAFPLGLTFVALLVRCFSTRLLLSLPFTLLPGHPFRAFVPTVQTHRIVPRLFCKLHGYIHKIPMFPIHNFPKCQEPRFSVS